jgi:hypothetical protein
MPTTYKVLGQRNPAATTEETIYTVPSATNVVCSTLTVNNIGTTDATVRLRIKINNAADANGQFVLYDFAIAAKDTRFFTFGATLSAGDVVRVYGSTANIAFSLFGTEIS